MYWCIDVLVWWWQGSIGVVYSCIGMVVARWWSGYPTRSTATQGRRIVICMYWCMEILCEFVFAH